MTATPAGATLLHMRLALAGLALALWACVPHVELSSPVSGDNSALLIVLSPENQGAPEVFGVERAERLPTFAARHGDRLLLFELSGTLEARGLLPGRLPIASTNEGAPLPAPISVHELVPPDTAWRSLEGPMPNRITALRLPDPGQCTGPNACGRLVDEEVVCERPCPTLTPLRGPPDVAPPQLAAIPCPTGWVATPDDGPGCRPPPRQLNCPQGQYQPLTSPGCVPIVPCPPGTDRPLPLGAVAYVDPNAASGGNGTVGQPFDTIAEAQLAVVRPISLVLTPGDHDLTAPVLDGVTLYGTCPEQTRIIGTVRVEAGATVGLDGVTLSDTRRSIVTAGSVRAEGVDARKPVELTGAGTFAARASRLSGLVANMNATGRIELTEVNLSWASTLDGGVALTGNRVAFDAPTRPLRLRGGTRVELNTAWLEGDADRVTAIWVEDEGQLEATGLFAEVPSFSLVTGEGQLRLEASGLRTFRAGTVTDLGRWTARRTRVASSEPTNLIFATDRAQVSLEGVDVRTTCPNGSTLRRCVLVNAQQDAQATLQDVRARGPTLTVRATHRTTVDLTRVESTGGVEAGASNDFELYFSFRGGQNHCIVSGLPREPQQVKLTVTDFRMEGVRDAAGIAACPGTQATLRNIDIRGAETGIFAECRGRCTDPDEVAVVDVDGLNVAGSTRTSDLGVLQRGGSLQLSRAQITGVEYFGLYVWGSDVVANDLVISNVGSRAREERSNLDVYCSENRSGELRGPGSAIMTETWSSDTTYRQPSLRLERFSLRRGACAGITMGVDGTFDAHEGRISSNLRGLNFIRCAEPTTSPTVVFQNNAQGDAYRLASPAQCRSQSGG